MHPTAIRLAANKLPRLTYGKIFASRVPYLGVWAGGMAFFFGWPHAWIAVSNKLHNAPDINLFYL